MSSKATKTLTQNPAVWVAAIFIVALLVVALSRDGASDSPAGNTIDPGHQLAELASPDPAIGAIAPRIVGVGLDGESIIIEPDGAARILGFFAHWCPHCQAELPRVTDWLATTTLPDGVEVIAVSSAVDAAGDNFPPETWFEETGWPMAVIADDLGAIAADFGLTAFPFWVVLDEDGAVVTRRTGSIPVEELDELVDHITPTEVLSRSIGTPS